MSWELHQLLWLPSTAPYCYSHTLCTHIHLILGRCVICLLSPLERSRQTSGCHGQDNDVPPPGILQEALVSAPGAALGAKCTYHRSSKAVVLECSWLLVLLQQPTYHTALLAGGWYCWWCFTPFSPTITSQPTLTVEPPLLPPPPSQHREGARPEACWCM